jgi:Zn-finger nucleic acid-binding protein
MNCPNCDIPLIITNRGDIEILNCIKCCGRWHYTDKEKKIREIPRDYETNNAVLNSLSLKGRDDNDFLKET